MQQWPGGTHHVVEVPTAGFSARNSYSIIRVMLAQQPIQLVPPCVDLLPQPAAHDGAQIDGGCRSGVGLDRYLPAFSNLLGSMEKSARFLFSPKESNTSLNSTSPCKAAAATFLLSHMLSDVTVCALYPRLITDGMLIRAPSCCSDVGHTAWTGASSAHH